MYGKLVSLAMVAALAAPALGMTKVAAVPGPGHLVVVKMVKSGGSDYRFSPAAVTVQPGDTVRWIQDSDAPHNVQFDSSPKGAKLGAAQSGPYLTSAGQTYEVVIDGRFPAGKYAYECTPHGAMGMKATLVVAPAGQ